MQTPHDLLAVNFFFKCLLSISHTQPVRNEPAVSRSKRETFLTFITLSN